jgi:hypothetical protein
MPTISDPEKYQAGVDALRVDGRSPKAWMTVRDADTLEALLLGAGRRAAGRGAAGPPRFLEWGSGLSTLHYTRSLGDAIGEFLWVTVEHDRRFFMKRVLPFLGLWSPAAVLFDDGAAMPAPARTDPPPTGIFAMVYDGGTLTPAEPGHTADRHADLDTYVAGPSRLNLRFDAIFVDGRKRRRCLLEARRMVADDGVVILHDAQRPYYHCAFSAYPASRRVADELWVGTPRQRELRDIVAEEALEGPASTSIRLPLSLRTRQGITHASRRGRR